jgi:hypothetical protein
MYALKRIAIFSVALFLLDAVAKPSRADTVIFNLNQSLNGATPVGTQPWLTATFTDVSPGVVQLVMSNNMISSEFVHDWLFNVANPPGAQNLTFQQVGGVWAQVSPLSSEDVTTGGAQTKGAWFDVGFIAPNNVNSFVGGTTSTWLITGSGLTASSFEVMSEPTTDFGTPPKGGYFQLVYSAADIRGITDIGQGTSGSIYASTFTVLPLPSTLAMMFATIVPGLGICWLRRRRA